MHVPHGTSVKDAIHRLNRADSDDEDDDDDAGAGATRHRHGRGSKRSTRSNSLRSSRRSFTAGEDKSVEPVQEPQPTGPVNCPCAEGQHLETQVLTLFTLLQDGFSLAYLFSHL